MKKLILALLGVAIIPYSAFSHLPQGFAQYEVASGLNPTDMDVAPDGRIFITEKNGYIRIVKDGILLTDPFLILPVNDFNERGLGHIALDPDFDNNGFIYIFYTVPDGTHNQLSRITAAGNFAMPGSETVLYNCDNSNGSVHHGGDIAFDLEGHILFSVGENGFGPLAQSLGSDLGKILRINPDGSIPADNPFYTSTVGKYKAIFALGLRNPFSLSIDPISGLIYVGDVGGQNWEEINDVRAGKNYGYPLLEGNAGNANVPTNYQDPAFVYDHNNGCAIVGAAFYNPETPAFPANYQGKFFFADYCKGYIRMFSPAGASPEGIFVSDIPRPVSICTTPSGDFYYLARAGLGGGSTEDNTASNNGSLWRVIYTGSYAPFIYGHPQSGLYSVGDHAKLQVFATGEAPYIYQWQKNGVNISGGINAELNIPNISLADSGSVFRCIIQNEYGLDTSNSAVIRVTSNKRPQPAITLPTAEFYYEGGTDIPFSGYATDNEDGSLGDSALSWKIYFYHDEHFHPALSPVTGIHDGSFHVENKGEPDDNVWYRLFLTATDSIGLQTTVFQDVFPKKSAIQVTTIPSGAKVDIDGITGLSPLEIQGVAGLERHLAVPDFISGADSVWLFQTWDNGTTDPEFNFTVPSGTQAQYTGLYDIYRTGKGFGLFGEYLHENLSEPAYLTRIDSAINFLWSEGSPAAGNIPTDGFTVRWSGTVMPYFDDLITFHTFSDDGVKLWVDSVLLIDKWQNQPATEYKNSISLHGGQRYDIRLEFLESSGAATVQLWWSSPRIPKSIVPKSQLFPPKNLIPNELSGVIWIDPNGNGTINEGEPMLENAIVLLTNETDNTKTYATLTDENGYYKIRGIPSGTYQTYVLPPLGYGALTPGFGLLPSGYALPVTLEGEEERLDNFSFLRENDPATTSDAINWFIAPNPSNGEVLFTKNYRLFTQNLKIKVLDLTGNLLLEQTSPAGEKDTFLSLSDYPPGVYVILADGRAAYLLLY